MYIFISEVMTKECNNVITKDLKEMGDKLMADSNSKQNQPKVELVDQVRDVLHDWQFCIHLEGGHILSTSGTTKKNTVLNGGKNCIIASELRSSLLNLH